MFYKFVYAAIVREYNTSLEELMCYKVELLAWVKGNEPEHWVMSYFGNENWGRMNNNMIEI